MVFKTHNLKKVPFNNLLFWNEQEDVEISKCFMEHSLIPRVNFISKVLCVNEEKKIEDAKNFIVLEGNHIKNKTKNEFLYSLDPFKIGNYRFLKKKHKFYDFQKRKLSIQIKFKKNFPFITIKVKEKNK